MGGPCSHAGGAAPGRRLGLIGWAAIAVALAAPSGAQEVRIGTWKTPQTIQPFFYEQFLPASIKPRVFAFTNPADQKTALLAGSLDVCGTTLAHAIFSASQGQPVVIVASLCNKASALVVRRDGPLRQVADLRGKRIGYVPGTMHEILLRETLIRSGLAPDLDVRLTRVDFFDMGTALAGGAIDAFLSGEPLPTLAVEQGYGRILSYPYFGDAIGTVNAALLVRRDTIAKTPQLLSEVVRAHARATEHLKARPEEWFRRAESFGTPRSVLEKAAPNIELAWGMDEEYIARTRALGERLQALHLIERQLDYDGLFDLSFVRAAATQLQP